MIDAITNLFTWRFGIGVVVGMLGQRAWCYGRARWLDRRSPLPGCVRRRIGGLNRVWVVGAAVALVLAYQLVEAQRLASCQQDYAANTAARAKINQENDRLSLAQRELLAEFQREQTAWLVSILRPPPDIAALDRGAAERDAYNTARTASFLDRAGDLNAGIEDISLQQRDLAAERTRHPVTDPTCGRG